MTGAAGKGKVRVIDTRPAVEFGIAHVEGSESECLSRLPAGPSNGHVVRPELGRRGLIYRRPRPCRRQRASDAISAPRTSPSCGEVFPGLFDFRLTDSSPLCPSLSAQISRSLACCATRPQCLRIARQRAMPTQTMQERRRNVLRWTIQLSKVLVAASARKFT